VGDGELAAMQLLQEARAEEKREEGSQRVGIRPVEEAER